MPALPARVFQDASARLSSACMLSVPDAGVRSPRLRRVRGGYSPLSGEWTATSGMTRLGCATRQNAQFVSVLLSVVFWHVSFGVSVG